MNGVTHGKPIEIRDITNDAEVHKVILPNDKIYVRSVKGTVESIRRYIGFFFLALFLVLPWITYDGKQAILLDFVEQRFHLFGLTLWPQDLTILAWLFIVGAFALFFVTAVWGRVWCGFMCPQTVFTFLFVWVEEKIEGARNKRIQLDKQPLSSAKAFKKIGKHSVWMLIALITSLTFVGYFTPIKSLWVDVFTFNSTFWPVAFVVFFALCTYGNAGWMREIMCTHMCPYSRFQSSMFDENTLTVSYNRSRGEGRGPRSRKLSQQAYQKQGLGDCIDCNLCVQVCPTGIDIRNGLQYECINCGACVDACNGVMSKMGYETGLISYASANSLNGKTAPLLRPKVVGYFAVLVIMMAALTMDILYRVPMGLDVIRDRNSLYRETMAGNIENVYTLVLMNKSQQAQTMYVRVEGLLGYELNGVTEVSVPANTLLRHPIALEVPYENIDENITSFAFTLENQQGERVSSESTFIKGL